jgi:UDP-glucose 4-epimerase
MRIFLTGATGFIGRRVLPLLCSHDVLCLTRNPERLVAWPFAVPLAGDLRVPGVWRAQLAAFGTQCCIHLAWQGLPDYSAEICRLNLDAGRRLIEEVYRAGAARIVVAGSCWEYGDASGAVSELHESVNGNDFVAAKNALRETLEDAARMQKIDYRWIRLFFVYGPGQRTTSLIPLCRTAFAAGESPNVRSPAALNDFVHVDDAAQGLVALALSDADSGIYNLGSGRPTAAGEIVNIVAEHYGVEPPYRECRGDGGFWSDNSKIFAACGWKARTPLAEGVAATLRALDRCHR